MSSKSSLLKCTCLLLGLAPALMGAEGGCQPTDEELAEIPDVEGRWEVTMDGSFGIDIDIGGVAYDSMLSPDESTVAVAVDGTPVEFTIDCSHELVQCPEEIVPAQFDIVQDPDNPRLFGVEVPIQECDGEEVEGECMGMVVETISTAPGTITADGMRFDLLLGGGVTGTTGCALLALYVADGVLVSSGSAAMMNKRAEEIVDGDITVGYAGGCLILDESAIAMEEVRAAAVGATIALSAGYTAVRVP